MPHINVRDLGRVRTITTVLVRHGFSQLVRLAGLEVEGEPVHVRLPLARRLRMVLSELGPTFVKLGQVLSTRADLLPASYCEQLGQLQDNLPPASREHAIALLARELNAPPEVFFERIPDVPVAAASLSQVYRARTKHGGLDVAVKLQRPGLAAAVALDATILRMLARITRRFVRLFFSILVTVTAPISPVLATCVPPQG